MNVIIIQFLLFTFFIFLHFLMFLQCNIHFCSGTVWYKHFFLNLVTRKRQKMLLGHWENRN